MSRTGAQWVQFSTTQVRGGEGPSPKPAVGSGPESGRTAPCSSPPGARPPGGPGRLRLGLQGLGMRLGAPPRCHRQGFCPPPVAERAVAVGRQREEIKFAAGKEEGHFILA